MIDVDRVKGWLLGLIACAIITLLAGCRTTKYVPVENVRTEYKDRVVTVHDTVRDSVMRLNDVYRHDSMTMMMRGDTVFVDRWHTLLQSSSLQNRTEESRAMHDTLYVDRTDSVMVQVRVPVKVPVPVERKLTKWEKTKMDFGTAAMVIAAMAIIAGIVLAVRWIRKRIRGDLR